MSNIAQQLFGAAWAAFLVRLTAAALLMKSLRPESHDWRPFVARIDARDHNQKAVAASPLCPFVLPAFIRVRNWRLPMACRQALAGLPAIAPITGVHRQRISGRSLDFADVVVVVAWVRRLASLQLRQTRHHDLKGQITC